MRNAGFVGKAGVFRQVGRGHAAEGFCRQYWIYNLSPTHSLASSTQSYCSFQGRIPASANYDTQRNPPLKTSDQAMVVFSERPYNRNHKCTPRKTLLDFIHGTGSKCGSNSLFQSGSGHLVENQLVRIQDSRPTPVGRIRNFYKSNLSN